MNARTEAEVDTMRSEFSVRIPVSAILRFLDDYDFETIIRCINAVSEEVFKE